MPQLAQRLCLNLPDPFPGDVKFLADFLQRPGSAVIQAEPQLDYVFLTRGQRVQLAFQLLAQNVG